MKQLKPITIINFDKPINDIRVLPNQKIAVALYGNPNIFIFSLSPQPQCVLKAQESKSSSEKSNPIKTSKNEHEEALWKALDNKRNTDLFSVKKLLDEHVDVNQRNCAELFCEAAMLYALCEVKPLFLALIKLTSALNDLNQADRLKSVKNEIEIVELLGIKTNFNDLTADEIELFKTIIEPSLHIKGTEVPAELFIRLDKLKTQLSDAILQKNASFVKESKTDKPTVQRDAASISALNTTSGLGLHALSQKANAESEEAPSSSPNLTRSQL